MKDNLHGVIPGVGHCTPIPGERSIKLRIWPERVYQGDRRAISWVVIGGRLIDHRPGAGNEALEILSRTTRRRSAQRRSRILFAHCGGNEVAVVRPQKRQM